MLTTLEFEMLREYRCNCALSKQIRECKRNIYSNSGSSKRRHPSSIHAHHTNLVGKFEKGHVLCGGMQL
jgi:hypothetical protein